MKKIIILLIFAIATNMLSAQENSHEYLLKNNTVYKANYERATEIGSNIMTVCAKISTERKLTIDESKAYLMAVYRSFTKFTQNWATIKSKKAFLGTYEDNSKVLYWNNATAEQIETKFAQLINQMKDEMKTKDLTKVLMPVYVSEEDKKIPIEDLF